MSITAFKGPLVIFGRGRPNGPASGIGMASDPNEDTGPQVFEYGPAFMDIRAPFAYQPGQRETTPFYAHVTDAAVVDAIPSTIATANIAAAQAPAANTPLTLVSVSGAGITTGVSIVRPDTGATVTGLLAIDSPMAPVAFGVAASLNIWNPATSLARAGSLTSAANLSAINFTFAGYDIYGYPMTQTIAGPNVNTVYTAKAFKYLASVTPNGSSASTVSVGTSDIYGFPLRAATFGQLSIFWANTLITASTGFVAYDPTSPASPTTGDVRGTYATQSASNGTNRLQIYWHPAVAALAAGVTGIYGVTQA